MATPAPMSNPGSKAPGAGGSNGGGNQPVVNPNASSIPIISGSEPDATNPQPNNAPAGTPATILSTGLASAMGVQVGTVVPSGTIVTPAQSAGQKGITTIETPDGKGGVVVTHVTPIAPDEGVATSPIANGPQKGSTPAVILSTGLAQRAGVPAGTVVPSGTVVDDNGLHLPNVPVVAPVMPGSTYYEFQNNKGGATQVSVEQYNGWTPQQQFAYQMSIGIIPLSASLVVNADGTWGYTESEIATAITSGGKDTGVLARYTNPDGTIDIQAALAGGVTADYILSNTQASASDVKLAQAINAVNSVLKANKDGTYNTDDINAAVASGKLTQSDVDTVFGKQTTPDYATWANQLPANLQVIYNKGGGGVNGYNAVINAQANALAIVNASSTTRNIDLGNGVTQVVPVYDFSKFHSRLGCWLDLAELITVIKE